MSAPFLVFLGTGLAALAGLPLRGRRRVASAISAVASVLIAAFVLLVKLEEPFVVIGLPVKLSSAWSVLGRAFILDDSNRAAVAFLYFAGAFIFGGAWLTSPGRPFFFIGLASLAVIAASFMIRPFLFAAIFLELAAMGAVLLLAAGDSPAKSGGLRLLILYTIAMLTILLTGWILESVGVTTATPELAERATQLLALGFAILMAVPPFHLWLPAAARESNPYALAFVTIILQSAGLLLMVRFLDTYAWLRENETLFLGIRIAATAMVGLGGLWAVAQRTLSGVMAYALLTDFGVMLLAVGSNLPEGFRLALGLSGVRVVSVAMLGLGLSRLELDRAGRHAGSHSDVGKAEPFAIAAILIGLLSLAGFPLTAGFPGRWALLATLAPIDPLASASILLALICLGGVTLRWVGFFLTRREEESFPEISFYERVFIGIGIATCVLLGLFPQILYPWVLQVVAGMSQLMP